MSTTKEEIDLLDERITALEINGARLDERLSSLVQSTANLKWSVWGFSLILLLTVVYAAIGPEGYKHVTSVYKPNI